MYIGLLLKTIGVIKKLLPTTFSIDYFRGFKFISKVGNRMILSLLI